MELLPIEKPEQLYLVLRILSYVLLDEEPYIDPLCC